MFASTWRVALGHLQKQMADASFLRARSVQIDERHGARQMASIFVIWFPVRFQLGPEIA